MLNHIKEGVGKGLYFSVCEEMESQRQKAAVREGVVDDDFNLAGGKTFNWRKHKEMEQDKRSEKMLQKSFRE